MHKVSIVTVSAFALFGSLAVAAPPPFNSLPTFTDNGTTMTAAGSLNGLGGGDLEITIEATGTETVVCADPVGVEPPPATEVVLTGSKVVTATANMPVAFADLVSSLPPAPACALAEGEGLAPQHDVSFTKASLKIRPAQTDPMLPPLKMLRCIQCTFTAPTVDGPAKPQHCLSMTIC